MYAKGKEVLLMGKAQYGWRLWSNWFRSAPWILIILFTPFLQKLGGYLYWAFPSVSIPAKGFQIMDNYINVLTIERYAPSGNVKFKIPKSKKVCYFSIFVHSFWGHLEKSFGWKFIYRLTKLSSYQLAVTPGAIVIKCFSLVTDDEALKVRAFDLGNPLRQVLEFEGKAKANPIGASILLG